MTPETLLVDTTLLSLYRFTVRRGNFCLRRIREILGSRGFEALVPAVDRALEVHWSTSELEAAYRPSRRNTVHGREAVELDKELMRALRALHGCLALTVGAFGPDSPQGGTAARLREALFPDGLGRINDMAFVEKESEVTAMLNRLAEEPELAQAVSELGSAALVERLAEVTERYRAAIQVKKTTFAEVREARRACQEQLIRVMVHLMSRRVSPDLAPEEGQALDLALGELLGHQEAIRRLRRQRRDPEVAELELGWDDESAELDDDESAEGPLPDGGEQAEGALLGGDETAEEREPGAPPPFAQPLDPPPADHDGAGASVA